jgi:hypothetical protein
MASERQIKANQRNAQKSTGPRTKSGIQRSSHNAYQHGLSERPILSAVAVQQVGKLARKIAGSSRNPLTLEFARSTAEAMLDLARVRRIKKSLLEQIIDEPIHNPRELLSPTFKSHLNTSVQQQVTASRDLVPMSADTRSHDGREQKSDPTLQILLKLRALDRYEGRISSRRDRAIRQISKRR